MTSSERSFLIGISVIAGTNLLTLSLVFARFVRTRPEDPFSYLPFLTLLIATVYAWLIPKRLLRTLEGSQADLRNRVFRGVFSLSLTALVAVQTGLLLFRAAR